MVIICTCIVLGIIDSPTTFIWVCVVTLIAQQLEGNVITPNVMGKSLSIHPLTIIVVILAQEIWWFHTYFNCRTTYMRYLRLLRAMSLNIVNALLIKLIATLKTRLI